MFDATIAKPEARREIPENSLLFGRVSCQELRKSAAGNDYLSIAIECEAPFKGLRILSSIMLIEGGEVSERGMKAVRAILEASGLSVEADPQAFKFASMQDIARAVNGKRCAIKTKKNTRGYDDVKVWLSPALTPKDWAMLNGVAASTGKAEAAPAFVASPAPKPAPAAPVDDEIPQF